MASKKTKAEEPQVENLQQQVEGEVQTPTEQQEQTPINEEKVENPTDTQGVDQTAGEEKKETAKKPAKAKGDEKEVIVEGKDIPENVKNILQCFTGEEKLYVDAIGGVFTYGTKPSERGSAILYRNPFFK